MPAVVSQDEYRPEHGALSNPIHWPGVPCCEVVRKVGEASNNQQVQQDMQQGAGNILHAG